MGMYVTCVTRWHLFYPWVNMGPPLSAIYCIWYHVPCPAIRRRERLQSASISRPKRPWLCGDCFNNKTRHNCREALDTKMRSA